MIRDIKRRIRAGEDHLASRGMHYAIPMFRRTMWKILLVNRILVVVATMSAVVLAVYQLI